MDWDQYAARWADQHGGYDPRRAATPVRGWLRFGYAVGRGGSAAGVSAATVGIGGLALAVAVALLAAGGASALLVAAVLVLLSAFCGTLDGAVTVLAGRPSPRSAIRRGAIGRLVEVGWLTGFWMAGVPGLLVVACGILTGLHEYVRGQALASGMSRIGAQTVAERPMRVTVTAVGLALAGLAGLIRDSLPAGALSVAASIWLLLAGLGVLQLSSAIRRTLQ